MMFKINKELLPIKVKMQLLGAVGVVKQSVVLVGYALMFPNLNWRQLDY